MGETARSNLIRAMSAMVVVVVLMTGTHQFAKDRSEDLLKRAMTSKTTREEPRGLVDSFAGAPQHDLPRSSYP